tara:strand:+ start:41 stop:367 length:327 start_codon:yes stop_codon:yes gene_type:complete
MTSEHPDFKVLEGFCEHNMDTLIQITITERKSKGFGALFMEVNHEKNNVDCRFIDKQTAYNTPGFKDIYDNLEKNNRPSVAFFVLVVYDLDTESSNIRILNIDLDKKS